MIIIKYKQIMKILYRRKMNFGGILEILQTIASVQIFHRKPYFTHRQFYMTTKLQRTRKRLIKINSFPCQSKKERLC